MNKVSVKPDSAQQLFIIRQPFGYSCLGFTNCQILTEKYEAWLSQRPIDSTSQVTFQSPPATPGTMEAFQRYQDALAKIREYNRQTGTRCNAELTPQLIGLEGRRVEVVDKYGEKRRFNVGKSTGFIPVHLEIHGKCDGGPAVMGAPFLSVTILK